MHMKGFYKVLERWEFKTTCGISNRTKINFQFQCFHSLLSIHFLTSSFLISKVVYKRTSCSAPITGRTSFKQPNWNEHSTGYTKQAVMIPHLSEHTPRAAVGVWILSKKLWAIMSFCLACEFRDSTVKSDGSCEGFWTDHYFLRYETKVPREQQT